MLIVTLLIIGGSLLASHKWNPSWNPFEIQEGKKSLAISKNVKSLLPKIMNEVKGIFQ